MAKTLIDFEQRRSAILTQILDLGDFRSGSITPITAKCGKASCRCHLPDQPGHGPNFRLTRKVKGKTISESFPSPAALRKAQSEIAVFHRFRQLSQELLDVNEEICRLRPVGELAQTAQEKKRPKPSSTKRRAK